MTLSELLDMTTPEPNTGCLLWLGLTSRAGYGRVTGLGQPAPYAHRMAVELATGAHIPPGLCICHRCDQPSCVNPDHLFIGTKKDNSQDMARKGRARGKVQRGEQSPQSKITEAQAREILRLKDSGVSPRGLASFFGIQDSSVSNIWAGRTWAHLETP